MSLPKRGPSLCPCCHHHSLHPNGAFLTCATCGLAITTQALLWATSSPHDAVMADASAIAARN